MTEYRIENKYLISYEKYKYLSRLLETCMEPDKNASASSYLIRSIYFDDYGNSCLRDIESGLNSREKFRIRTYNNDSSFIKLELKRKINAKTKKDSVILNRTEAGSIINNNLTINASSPYLLKKFWCEQQINLLRPVSIVEYERIAFTEPVGNVRITFDINIGYCNDIFRFFDDNILAVPALAFGINIMEIKYDEFLPGYIRKIINDGSLQRTSFSKYYYARRNIYGL